MAPRKSCVSLIFSTYKFITFTRTHTYVCIILAQEKFFFSFFFCVLLNFLSMYYSINVRPFVCVSVSCTACVAYTSFSRLSSALPFPSFFYEWIFSLLQNFFFLSSFSFQCQYFSLHIISLHIFS